MASLTSWLDGFLGYFANQAGLPVDEYTSMTAGEGIATGIETVTDFFLKGIINKLVQGIAGIALGSYGIWGNGSKRLKRELIAIGNHLMFRLLDPSPQEIVELRESLEKIIDAIQKGDLAKLADATLRTPDELKMALGALGVQPSTFEIPKLEIPKIPELPKLEAVEEVVKKVTKKPVLTRSVI